LNIININDSAIKEVAGAGWCSCNSGREFSSDSKEACRLGCQQTYGKNVNWHYSLYHIPKIQYQGPVVYNKIYSSAQK